MAVPLEYLPVTLAAAGGTGWYVAQQKFIDLEARDSPDLPPSQRFNGGIYAFMAPGMAGISIAITIATASVLGIDTRLLGGFGATSAEGLFLAILSGLLIAFFYRKVGEVAQARGKGVFAVWYYLSMIVLTAITGAFQETLPTWYGWFGLLPLIFAVFLINGRSARIACMDRPATAAWFRALGSVVAASFFWILIQRVTFQFTAQTRIGPGGFAALSASTAATAVLLMTPARGKTLARLSAQIADRKATSWLLFGSLSLALMYACLAAVLVHDMSSTMWLYYALMLILLALSGHLYLRRPEDILDRRQLWGVVLAMAGAILICIGKSTTAR